MNIRTTYNDPDYRRALDNLLNAATSGDPEEYARMKQVLSAAKANVTRSNRLETAGIDTEELLRPVEESKKPGGLASLANELRPYGRKAMSTLGGILKIADTDRNFVAKKALVPLLGLDKQLGDKEEVFTSDILGALGMEEGVLRGALGLAGDIAFAPSTWLTGGVAAGARMVGGKALSKAGKRFGADIAKKLAVEAGEKAITPQIEGKAFDILGEMIKSKSPQITSNMIDRGGLKWMGKSIIPTEGFEWIGDKAKNAYEFAERSKVFNDLSQNILRPAGRWLGRSFVYGYGKTKEELELLDKRRFRVDGAKYELSKDLKHTFNDLPAQYWKKGTGEANSFIDFTEDIAGIGRDLPESTVKMIAARNGIPEAEAMKLYKVSKKSFEVMEPLGKELKDLGIYEDYMVNSFAHGYEILKRGPDAQKVGDELKSMMTGGIGKARIIPSMKEARGIVKEKGAEDLIGFLGPVESFAMRYLAAKEAIINQKYMTELVSSGIAKGANTKGVLIASARQAIKKGELDKYLSKGEYKKYLTKRENAGKKIEELRKKLAETYNPESEAKIELAIERLTQMQKGDTYGMPQRAFAKSHEIDDLILRNREGLERIELMGKEYMLPTEVAQDVYNLKTSGLIGQRETKAMARVFDSFQNFFKKIVTIPNPAFHGRNIPSDISRVGFRSLMGLFNPKIQKSYLQTLFTSRDKLAGKFLETKLGTRVPLESIHDFVRMEGLYRIELGRADIDKGVRDLFKQNNPYNLLGGYMRLMEKFGVFSENSTRLLHFLVNIHDGLSLKEAAAMTRKFHYDYGALTEFEKRVGRRLIPFYPWMKKNTTFILKSFYERPGKLMGAIRLEDVLGRGFTDEEREAMPEFAKDQMSLPLINLATGDKGVLTNIDMPWDDLNELGLGLGGGKSLRKMATRLTPPLKYMMELLSGTDMYYGTPLKEKVTDLETGETKYPYNKAYDYLASIPGLRDFLKVQEVESKTGNKKYVLNPTRRKELEMLLGMGTGSRALSEINKLHQILTGKGGDRTMGLLNFLTGLKIYPIDVEQQKMRDLVGDIRQKQFLLSKTQ